MNMSAKRGHVDMVRRNLVYGWAMDGEKRCKVDLFIDNVFINSVWAFWYRDDLRSISKDGQHAFTVKIPGSYCDGVKRVVEIRYSGTEVVLNNGRFDYCYCMNFKFDAITPDNSVARFFRRETLRTIVDEIENAIDNKSGFSVVRLGDGEGPILCWPFYKVAGEIENVTRIWFGNLRLSDDDINSIAEGLRQSVCSSDVLGLPTLFQTNRCGRYEMVYAGLAHIGLNDSRYFSDANLHFYLQWSGAIYRILRNREHISVISCRDVSAQISDAFGIKSVRMYLVRGEHANPGGEEQNHWPDGFNKTMSLLDNIDKGEIFLVGAGVLGKIYCHKIKSQGGIAIDIGSILDSWSGLNTRERFDLTDLSFRFGHFSSIKTDWESMNVRMQHFIQEFDVADATY